MAHVAEWKKKEVEELRNIIKSYPLVGIAHVGGIPAPQMQQLRSKLRDTALIKVVRNTLVSLALDEVNKEKNGIAELKNLIEGETAIIAAKDINPFKLFQIIKSNRINAPAKGGEIAPKDIMVKAGDTPFKPGPIVGELQKAGIPAAIEEGKVVIKKDKVVVPAGEKISPQIAQILTRMEIYPLEIGINLKGMYENGIIFTPDILDINRDEYVNNLINAAKNAFNLAVNSGWVNKFTIDTLISMAGINAYNLAINIRYPTRDTVKQLLSIAHLQMLSLSSILNADALDEDLKKKIGK
ncbi:MAG TPA: 50S ribosomal protein L10 [Thermoplasmatales archaeon]|nr:50S ribosomal protein L10 [Thermoplasmatales archaeon]